MKSLFAFIYRQSRSLLVISVLSGVLSGICNTGLLVLINAALREPGSSNNLVLFLLLCLLVPVTRIVAELLLVRLGQNTILELRSRLARQILGLPLKRLEEIGSHRLLSALTDDLPTISGAATQIPSMCINAAVFVASLVYLGFLSPAVLAATVLLIGIAVVGYQLPIVHATRLLEQARLINDKLYFCFRALVEGIKELKLNRRRRDEFLVLQLDRTAREYQQSSIRGMRIFTVAASWGQLLLFVIIGLIVFALPRWIEVSSIALSGYALTLLYLVSPLQMLMNQLPGLGRARVALQRVEALGVQISALPSETEGESLRPSAPGWSSVELREVEYQYASVDATDRGFALGPLSLTLRPGDLVFLAGGNGSGKTTLAKLLTGLYRPDRGTVLLDGEEVGETNIEPYRQMFSAIFFDFFLFEELLGFDRQGLDEKARELLRAMRLDSKVEVGAGRFSTIRLSQGQRKRLALLVALLEDREIFLFDEWAADQDPAFRDIFYLEILPALKAKGKAIVVISHDDRYFHHADRLLKLELGKLIETEKISSAESSGEEFLVAVTRL